MDKTLSCSHIILHFITVSNVFYSRLMLDVSLRHVTAYVNHNSGLKVVQASTKEFCISRHLHKTSDTAAAFNVGRVIALRCKESGLDRVMWEHKWDRKRKKVSGWHWRGQLLSSCGG